MPLLPMLVVDDMDVGKSNIPAAIMATIIIPRVEIPVTVAEAMVVVRWTHALIRVTQLAATTIVSGDITSYNSSTNNNRGSSGLPIPSFAPIPNYNHGVNVGGVVLLHKLAQRLQQV
jgi:hypothetical protein